VYTECVAVHRQPTESYFYFTATHPYSNGLAVRWFAVIKAYTYNTRALYAILVIFCQPWRAPAVP